MPRRVEEISNPEIKAIKASSINGMNMERSSLDWEVMAFPIYCYGRWEAPIEKLDHEGREVTPAFTSSITFSSE